MPYASANDIEIHYEETGDGEPLVLVHGGWSDRDNWLPVAPALAETFRVIAYDRRGHGLSERPIGQGTRRDQEDDLAALIEVLDLGPANLVGTSFGASIAIGVATRRPDLVRTLTAHEPPLISLVADDPRHQALLAEVAGSIAAVSEHLARGEYESGARRFVEEVALGPGSWELLPQPVRATMIDTAPSFAAEQLDSAWAAIDRAALSAIDIPVLLTQGDAGPEWFLGIVAALREAIPGPRVLTYPGAGHAPHITHPEDHVRAVTEFLLASREPALAR